MLLSKKMQSFFCSFIVLSSLILSQTLVTEDVLTEEKLYNKVTFFSPLFTIQCHCLALHKLHLSAKNSPATPSQLAGRKHSLSLK